MDIHLIHKKEGFDSQGPLQPIEGKAGLWESGYWRIGKKILDDCEGENLYLHEKQSAPSYCGGVIKSYSLVKEGQYKGRVVFFFTPTPNHKGVKQVEGWYREKSIRRV